MQTQTLKITGMNTDQCAVNVGEALRRLDGVADVRVSLLRSQAEVQFDEGQLTVPKLQEALAQAGFSSAAAKTADQGSCCGGCCS